MVTERPSVLVVDDQPAMRLAMTRVLERAGYEVTRCEDGREALSALDARPWDAMVSDVRMPGVDGRELLGRALALRPALKVIMVTAFGTVEDAVEAIRRGAHDYLLKPFAPEALVAAVQRALAGRAERVAPGEAPHPPIVGREPRFADLLARVRLAAASDATVLLTGESGTGKEVIARLLHAESPRAAGPFVAVNCAALPGDLLEAELFGVCKGAFTGADRDRKGRFERACGGTLLLDEIGDLPVGLQAKLLRALEERVVVPLGGGTPRPLDLRLVAATHQDLGQAVADGRFRQDLYFRLSVIPLRVPALRERAADVALLAQHMAGRDRGADGEAGPRDHAARADADGDPPLAGQRARAEERDGARGRDGPHRRDRHRRPVPRWNGPLAGGRRPDAGADGRGDGAAADRADARRRRREPDPGLGDAGDLGPDAAQQAAALPGRGPGGRRRRAGVKSMTPPGGICRPGGAFGPETAGFPRHGACSGMRGWRTAR